MNEEMKKIIKKVQKLYALAERTDFPEEAESAVAKAQELLREYNLSLNEADFEIEENSQCVEHRVDSGLRRSTQWHSELVGFIQYAFDIKAIHSSRYVFPPGNKPAEKRVSVRFVGVEPDTSLAMHTYSYLTGVALRHRAKGKNTTQLNHWRIGFVEAVGARLVESRQKAASTSQETGLVLVKDAIIKKYMGEHYPNLKTHRIRSANINPTDFLEGREAGRKVPLSRPIEHDETAPLATLS